MTLEPGKQLLHYRLVEKIGEGGMGAVWRARDTTLERDVAIKVLPEQVAHDGERLARFDREAKLLAQLNHPNIAAIYGFHRTGDNLSFLALELVEGEDLAHRLARGPLPVDEALDVFRQIAEALEAAHERGVVHRDLKPANVKLTPDGKVKVLDFGLAKAMAPDAASGGTDTAHSPTMTTDRTRAGVILGTAAYMSPEQARGRPLDRRTDLWSFGCVMHECLTGTQIFRGETVSDSLAAILRKEIDGLELPAGAPPSLRQLVRRCLTRDPRKRLQDAGDARVELEQAIENPSAGDVAGVAAPAPPGLVRLGPWLVTLLAVVVALSIWLGGNGTVSSGPSISRRLTIPVPGPTSFGDLAASPPAISPDGRLVVFGVTDKGETKLWLRPLNDFAARPVAGAEGAQYAFWSPDSRHVGFFRGGRLRRIELATGREQAIGGAGSTFPRGGSWNARGQIVFAPNSNSGIYLIDAAGGEPRPITTPDPDIPDGSHRWPSFLSDGDHFLFTLWTNDPDARQKFGGVYVAAVSGGEPPRRLVADASNGVFVPPDHLLLSRGNGLVVLPFDLAALQVTGEPVLVADDVLINNSNGHCAFSVSGDGTLVYATGEALVSSSLRWYDRAGAATDTPVEPAPFGDTRLAPEARRTATAIPGPTGDGEIWIVDLVRGVRMRLAHGAAAYDYPVWSADGNRILYADQIGGGFDFFTRRSDGSGDAEPFLVDGQDKTLYDWSRDGNYVVYWPTGSGGGTPDIWIYSVERGKSAPLLSGDPAYLGARFSPDGRRIAYVSDESGRREVFIQALDGPERTTAGARWQVSTAGGVFPHWRDDGRELLYLDPQQRVMAVAIEPVGSELRIGTPVELFALDGTIVGMDATGDHRRVLASVEESVRSEPLRVVLDWPAEIAGR